MRRALVVVGGQAPLLLERIDATLDHVAPSYRVVPNCGGHPGPGARRSCCSRRAGIPSGIPRRQRAKSTFPTASDFAGAWANSRSQFPAQRQETSRP
jgi:hypothetical protein